MELLEVKRELQNLKVIDYLRRHRTILIAYRSNNRLSKCTRQKVVDVKEETGNSTTIANDFNISF